MSQWINESMNQYVMANAGVEYMVSESRGSNPVPLDYLSWVPLTDFVAILVSSEPCGV